MRKYSFLILALLVVGTLVGAHAVRAQGDAVLCSDPVYDLNNDGLVSQADGAVWKANAVNCVDPNEGFVSASACRAAVGDATFELLDVDQDGDVDVDDGGVMGARMWACFSRFVHVPRQG